VIDLFIVVGFTGLVFAYHGLMYNLHIMAVGQYCDPESFPDTSKVIQVFQIQIQTKNYIAKYNANTKTESCLNPDSCHCY